MIGILSFFLFLSMILLFANISERNRLRGGGIGFLGLVAYGLIALMHLGLFFVGIGVQLVGVAIRSVESQSVLESALGDLDELMSQLAETGIQVDQINFDILGAGVWIPALLSLLVLLPPVRRMIGRIIPIDPLSRIHAIALSFVGLIFPNLFFFLGIGLENVTQTLNATGGSAVELLLTTWAQNLGFFVMGLFGVGFLARRNLAETLQRLKLHVPTLRQVGIGMGLGVVALVVLGVVTTVADSLGLGDPVVDALSEELYGPFFTSIGGILTVGLAAAWGEETVFRGAIQPRFGRITTAALFALVHGNYGLSIVTLAIFGLGYLLGYIRDKHNTTTAMITHATFNSIQALLAFIAITYGLG